MTIYTDANVMEIIKRIENNKNQTDEIRIKIVTTNVFTIIVTSVRVWYIGCLIVSIYPMLIKK